MIWLKKRQLGDVDRWVAKGWITPDNAEHIRGDINTGQSGASLLTVMMLLGAALLCAGAISFVAANWSGMPRGLRLIVLFAGMALAYAGAAWAYINKHEAIKHGAVLLGCGMFGANIMLIAQMYNISGNPTDAVLMWGAGSILAGLLLRSSPATLLALGLFSLWMTWRYQVFDQVEFWYLPLWALTAFAFWRTGWAGAYHFQAAGLLGWLFLMCHAIGGDEMYWVMALIGLVILAVGFMADHLSLPAWTRPDLIRAYGLGTAFAGTFLWQVAHLEKSGAFWIAAAVSLGVLIAVLVIAKKRDDIWLTRTAYVGIIIQILTVYFITAGSLMGNAAFFVVAGILVLSIPFVLKRLERKS